MTSIAGAGCSLMDYLFTGIGFSDADRKSGLIYDDRRRRVGPRKNGVRRGVATYLNRSDHRRSIFKRYTSTDASTLPT